MPTDMNDIPGKSPEILSRQSEALIMPYAVDTPVEPEQVPISEILERSGQVGVTSTAGEIIVEPVEEIPAEQQHETHETDVSVRTLPRGHVWLMLDTPPPRRRGSGSGAWWYIRKHLRIPGISDTDDD